MRAIHVAGRSVLAAIAIAGCACSGPTSACDPRATSAFNTLEVVCTPTGSDAACTATAKNINLYTCGTTSLDVTSSAVFTSSDPSIARVGAIGAAPGFVTAVGTGNVAITARYLDLTSNPGPNSTAYMFFSPGAPSEHLADLMVTVRNAATLASLASASVTVTPDKGLPQSCVTNSSGFCDVQLRHGVYIIAATATGFQPGQTTLGSGATALSLTLRVDLIPKSP